MGDSPFARQLQLDGGQGRYRVDVDAKWNCPIVPHGGLVTAVAVKAMATELANPEERLRTVTTVFAGAVRPGPVEIDVTVLRRGRSISQATATLRNLGADAGLTAVAVFGASRPGFEFTDLVAPDVPPPEACRSFRDGPEPDGPYHFAFWDQADCRIAKGHARNDEFGPSESSERVYWYRFDDPPFLDDDVLDPLALVTLADTMPGAVAERVGTGTPAWLPPSADLTVHLFEDTTSDWLLARNHCRRAGDGYASLDMELWSPEGRLLAYGTQVALFVFPDGGPE